MADKAEGLEESHENEHEDVSEDTDKQESQDQNEDNTDKESDPLETGGGDGSGEVSFTPQKIHIDTIEKPSLSDSMSPLTSVPGMKFKTSSQAKKPTNKKWGGIPLVIMPELSPIKSTTDSNLMRNLQQTIAEMNKNPANVQGLSTMVQPRRFTGGKLANAKRFISEYSDWANLSRLSDSDKVTIFPYFLVGEAKDWFLHVVPPAKRTGHFSEIAATFMQKWGPQNLNYLDRLELLARKQGTKEEFEIYITDLRNRFSICNATADEKYRIFMDGLDHVFKTIILEKDIFNFEKAVAEIKRQLKIKSLTTISTVNIEQQVRKGLHQIAQESPRPISHPSVNVLYNNNTSRYTDNGRTSRSNRSNNYSRPAQQDSQPPTPCRHCNGDHWNKLCPTIQPGNSSPQQSQSQKSNQLCFLCDSDQHFARECPARTPYDTPPKRKSYNTPTQRNYYDRTPQRNPPRMQTNKVLCTYCQKPNHDVTICRSKEWDDRSHLFCNFCQINGHKLETCRRQASLKQDEHEPKKGSINNIRRHKKREAKNDQE